MFRIGYLIAKLRSRITGNNECIHNYLREGGIKIGQGCNIYCNILTAESELISIGDNVTISSEVVFITHDNSCNKINPQKSNLFGKITIGNNCFIGQRSTILYGVSLANNIIVAAGSLVVNSFDEEGIIIGGNPAKKIGTWESYMKKNSHYMMTRSEFSENKDNPDKLISRPPRKNKT